MLSPNDHHPEDPRRIEEIFNVFKDAGLIYTGDPAEVARVFRDTPNKYMYRLGVLGGDKGRDLQGA